MRRREILGAGAAGLGLLASGRQAWAAYPERPITMICPWGAGGGTDATARIIASVLEQGLGKPINVVNRTGGSGVVGHSAIALAPADGYTIGIITVEIGMMHYQGLTALKGTDYTPIGLVNEDPPGLQVRADSPWKTTAELLEGIKAAPKGKLKASGTGQGGIWHVALGGMLLAMGLPADHIQWVPSNGAAPGLQDLVAGGVDIAPCSLPEAKSLIDAGKVRSLAVMADERNASFPDVPTLKESGGFPYAAGAWRGIAAPKNLPKPIADTLVAGVAKAFESQQYKDFMNSRGFGMIYADPAGFEKFMAERDAMFGKVMPALGLAKS